MIGVAVREENRVDAAYAVRERLRAQIGGGVDKDRSHRVVRGGRLTADDLDENRRP